MRVKQRIGTRGSLKWIQRAVESRPGILQPAELGSINWVSPLRVDEFAEYRDSDFLNKLGLSGLSTDLAEFWPRRGPQWDALGLVGTNPVLVEAKAHLREFQSPPSAASEKSRRQIQQAFQDVQQGLEIGPRDWLGTYYQYANRIAHLWWLRSKGVDATLILVGFVGDKDFGVPAKASEWHAAYRTADAALGLPETHGLSKHILHLEPDVSDLI